MDQIPINYFDCAHFQNEGECFQNDPFNEFKEIPNRKTIVVVKEVLTPEENTPNDTEATNIEHECEFEWVLLLDRIHFGCCFFHSIPISQEERGCSVNDAIASTTAVTKNPGKNRSKNRQVHAHARPKIGKCLKRKNRQYFEKANKFNSF